MLVFSSCPIVPQAFMGWKSEEGGAGVQTIPASVLWEGLGGRVGLHRAKSPACWENLLVMEGGMEHGAPRCFRKEQGLGHGTGTGEPWLA